MQDVNDLTESLINNYEQMKAGYMPISTGKELANTAGKIMTSIKLQLEYNQMMDYKRVIEFLEPK